LKAGGRKQIKAGTVCNRKSSHRVITKRLQVHIGVVRVVLVSIRGVGRAADKHIAAVAIICRLFRRSSGCAVVRHSRRGGCSSCSVRRCSRGCGGFCHLPCSVAQEKSSRLFRTAPVSKSEYDGLLELTAILVPAAGATSVAGSGGLSCSSVSQVLRLDRRVARRSGGTGSCDDCAAAAAAAASTAACAEQAGWSAGGICAVRPASMLNIQ
jgi:hypothetical protein